MITRIACAAVSGTVVTLLLLFFMQALIRYERPGVEPRGTPFFELASVRILRDPPPEVEPLPFQKLKPPVVPPTARPGVRIFFEPVYPTWPTASPPLLPEIEPPVATGEYDRPLVTVMAVEPAYPFRASQDEREGFVTVRFDVLADGSVTNVAVIEASHPIFVASAIDAISRFRFKARMVSGVPQPSVGLQRRFVYRMERG